MFEKDLLVIKNPEVPYENFAGAENQYNPEGRRTFIVVVPQEDVVEAMKRGFRVRPHQEKGHLLTVHLAEGGFPDLYGFRSRDTIKIYPKSWEWKPGMVTYSGVQAVLSSIVEE